MRKDAPDSDVRIYELSVSATTMLPRKHGYTASISAVQMCLQTSSEESVCNMTVIGLVKLVAYIQQAL